MGDARVTYSVIIPTYNREPLLVEALRSVHGARPDFCEVIVVNDGTAFEPSTQDLIETLGAVFVQTKGGLGAGAARNIGAEHARGQWLLFLDDDDLIAAGYWQAVTGYIDAHLQSTDLAYGFCRASIQSDRSVMQQIAAAPAAFHIEPQEDNSLRPKIAGLGLGFWVSKALYHRVGGLNAELRTNEDTDFCLKLLSAGARCHNTKSHGAVIFQGDHGTAAASSTTKRYGPGQRARYFKHILDSQAEILATDSNTQAWLWKRYLKMAARAGGLEGYQTLRQAVGLTAGRKRLLAAYWAVWRVLAQLERR
jgi:GT2 family glycosyltransferase